MKIRMITFHTPKNYGAVLQAYSLMKYLQTKCKDVKIIDFNTKELKKKYSIISKSKSIKGFIRNVVLLPESIFIIKKHKKFNEFVKNNLALTRRYGTYQQLENETWDSDTVFTTGSDQVFNTNRALDERKAFYLDFVPKKNYKFSYAASFGISNISVEKEQEISNYLNKFDSISVREASGAKIIKELNNQDVSEVIDPVFLHNKAFWQKISTPYKIKRLNKYLLYYRLMNNEASDKIAKEKAKELGLKLIVIGNGFKKSLRGSRFLRDVGPKEFIWLYDNASYVVTNSFHGVAFSIIFEKQFTYADNNTKTSDRGMNILNKLKIDRYNFKDYNNITKELLELQTISKRYIDYNYNEIENRLNNEFIRKD